jgi:hypothetical protein
VLEEETVTGVEKPVNPFNLSVYPNPLTGSSDLVYTIASPLNISIDVYNLQGQRVKHLWKGFSASGHYQIKVGDTQSIPDGLYIIRIDGGDTSDYIKVMVHQ